MLTSVTEVLLVALIFPNESHPLLLFEKAVNLNLDGSFAATAFFLFFCSYLRQGQKCSQQELGASAVLTIALDDSLGQRATQVIRKSVCHAHALLLHY